MDYTLRKLKKAARETDPRWPVIKLAILGDFATQHLVICLKGIAATRGILIDEYKADYNQIEMQIADAQSKLYSHNPEFVLLALCTEKLYQAFCAMLYHERWGFSDLWIAKIRSWWQAISERMPASMD